MNLRKITSMTLVWSGVVLFFNSLVLYVVPEGRVAYWSDWRFLGLTKSDWGSQHTTVGFLFLAAGMLHIYYNWRPIISYMKDKYRRLKVFSAPSTTGFLLVGIFVVGTLFHLPPMSTIISLSDHFKEAAAVKYGEPPYGHAETSSLKLFAQRLNLDLAASIESLTRSGLTGVKETETILELAKRAGKTPQQIFDLIRQPAPGQGASGGLTPQDFISSPQSGLGNKTLASLCQTYGLDLDKITAGLSSRGVIASPELKLKAIAESNGTTPLGIYELMVEIVKQDQL